MVSELWRLFPRLIEENINGLLDAATPNALKAFQIYKTLQREALWSGGLEKFSQHLDAFFARPRAERRKSHFDIYLDRPMDHETYSRFHLNFRTAVVDERALGEVASWAHNLIRVAKKSNSAFASLDVLTKTLKKITNPSPFERAERVEFRDFCAAWKTTVYRVFGVTEDRAFTALLKELEWLHTELRNSELKTPAPPTNLPGIYLTQTELDWTRAVQRAACNNLEMPRYPLARGPQKQPLKDLERVAALFTTAQVSRLPELIKNKESIRLTVIDRCDALLKGQP